MAGKEKVNLKKIQQKSIRRFLHDEKLRHAGDFSELRSSRHLLNDSFRTHFKQFLVKAPVEQVWNAYLHVGPGETWNDGWITYGFTYHNENKTFSYPEDPYHGLKEGQILFLNLKLLFGLVNITVTHKVIEINKKEGFIYICYLEKNKSAGSQHISFEPTSEGHTIISHKTSYKSDSGLRDKIYPFMHGMIISKFHKVFKKEAEEGLRS